MAALYLTEDDVAALVDMPATIVVVTEAFKRLVQGEAENVPRRRSRAGGALLHSMSAAAAYLGRMAWKQYSTTRGGARFLVGLYDAETGQLLSMMEADRLGRLRTGAATAIAVDCMAAADANEVGLFGTGVQAEFQLRGIAAVRPLRRAVVYGRDKARREAFAREMETALGVAVVPVDRPSEAVENLPLVVTATASREPVFEGQWLAEGALVCAMGSNALSRAEIDATTVRRADNIVCDSIEACRLEAGDFVDALSRGDFDYAQAVNLGDVLLERAVGRSHASSIGLFKSVGLAIEDLALASLVYDRAVQQQRGERLPL